MNLKLVVSLIYALQHQHFWTIDGWKEQPKLFWDPNVASALVFCFASYKSMFHNSQI